MEGVPYTIVSNDENLRIHYDRKCCRRSRIFPLTLKKSSEHPEKNGKKLPLRTDFTEFS